MGGGVSSSSKQFSSPSPPQPDAVVLTVLNWSLWGVSPLLLFNRMCSNCKNEKEKEKTNYCIQQIGWLSDSRPTGGCRPLMSNQRDLRIRLIFFLRNAPERTRSWQTSDLGLRQTSDLHRIACTETFWAYFEPRRRPRIRPRIEGQQERTISQL